MRILLIGGTGTISSAITALISKRIASGESKDELWVLNRGKRAACLPSGVRQIVADAYDKESLSKAVDGLQFDVVCYFIGFELNQVIVAHDVFAGKIKQFVYISSASAYQKPPASYLITESTPLENPFWEYSRKKIQCEDYLFEKYRAEGFPATIVRPSHTYCERSVPVGLHGAKGSWQVLKRMIEGKPVIVHGDGTSLWTMT
ncbi:MAG: NAD-dependent epimerase/dehydratase family protein, partial [Spirochaetales bacterium]|nr:NAD-dependent epimerase/dehydratase family protein [Spirochaetales bacterium]